MTVLPRRTWQADVHAGLSALITTAHDDAPPVAALDWDDTLFEGDASLALLRWVDARDGTTRHDDYFDLLARHGRPVAYPAITQWFAGETPESFAATCRDALEAAFAEDAVRFRPEMVDLVDALLRHDWDVWVITASPAVLVQQLAPRIGIAPGRVIGMRTTLDPAGRYTDTVVPPATFCAGKAEAVRQHLPRLPALAAGDSRSDVDMLDLAAHALLVDGHDADLRAEAHTKGWWIQGGWRHTPAEPGVPTRRSPEPR